MQQMETSQNTLAGIDLFTDLSKEQLHAIETKCQWLNFSEDQTIFERDVDSDGVYFVTSGGARVVNDAISGEDITYADVEVGNFFGELSCIGDYGRSARVVAREDTVVAVLPRGDFIAMLKEFPDLAIRLIEYLSSIIRQSNERVKELVDLSPDQRIYAELIRMASQSAKDDRIWLIDPLPMHSEISGRAGTESQDVSLAVGTLIREGVARRRDNSLIINDYPKLRMLRGL